MQKENKIISESFWRDDLDERPVMVTVQCCTYNQKKYIADALNSFVNQEVNFRYEVIVHDDASNDGTTEIIKNYAKKYPSLIKPIFESKNIYSEFGCGGLTNIMSQYTRGKYIAICEGDDYWYDIFKLQKQFDFLENNSEYGMVHTAFSFLYDNGDKIEYKLLKQDNRNVINQILNKNKYRIQTCTAMVLSKLYFELIVEDPFLYTSNHFLMADTQLWIGIARKMKVGYIPDNTAIYRIVKNSACRQIDALKKYEFCLNCCEQRKYIRKQYKLGFSFENEIEFNYFWMITSLLGSKRNQLFTPLIITRLIVSVSSFFNRSGILNKIFSKRFNVK